MLEQGINVLRDVKAVISSCFCKEHRCQQRAVKRSMSRLMWGREYSKFWDSASDKILIVCWNDRVKHHSSFPQHSIFYIISSVQVGILIFQTHKATPWKKKNVKINIYPYPSCKDVHNTLTEAYACHRNQTKTFCKTGCVRNRGKTIRKYLDHSRKCLIPPGGTHCLLLRHHWFLPWWLRRDKNLPLQSRNTEIIAPKQSAKITGLKLDCAFPSPHSEGATRELLRPLPQLPECHTKERGEVAKHTGISCKWTQVVCSKGRK